jgi:hypothetical protein
MVIPAAPGRRGAASLRPRGEAPLRGATTQGRTRRRAGRGDPKRLVREAGGACPRGRCPSMRQEPNAVWAASQMGKLRTTADIVLTIPSQPEESGSPARCVRSAGNARQLQSRILSCERRRRI